MAAGKRATPAITSVRVEGFKSIRDPIALDLAPLTIIAGQNSAGKSTLMQPLLLMKQTLEAQQEPDPLLLHGELVKVHDASTLFWKGRRTDDTAQTWSVALGTDAATCTTTFSRSKRFHVKSTRYVTDDVDVTLTAGTRAETLHKIFHDDPIPFAGGLVAKQRRCGFVVTPREEAFSSFVLFDPLPRTAIADIIHLPGLRGVPERAYPVTRVEDQFPGAFPPYAASVLLAWKEHDDARAAQVGQDLADLGLTWKVEARQLDDARVTLWVGRLRKAQQGGAKDLVNIADVGVGVSQALPIVVALRAAAPGQIVHVEQPEIHLHPNAQVRMARLLVEAARRGVRVVAETHSAVLLKAIQVEVAMDAIEPDRVSLAWFARDDDGATQMRQGTFDHDGAYGDWPVDFGDVELDVERRFIDAVLTGTPS